jgi:hypothetical protein
MHPIRLWVRRNDAWTRFARVREASQLRIPSSDGDVMTGIGPDGSIAYVSTDAGMTETEIDPG